MKGFGIGLLVAGLAIIIYSFTMKTYVESYSNLSQEANRVNNIGLLQTQQNFLILGTGIFIAGILLIGFAEIQTTIRKSILPKETTNSAKKNKEGKSPGDVQICPACGKANPPEFENCRFCNTKL